MAFPEEDAKCFEGLLDFHEWEVEQYGRQKLFSRHKLFVAEDAMDLFSNHAQTHVAEVMEQCRGMYLALKGWIEERLPRCDHRVLLKHLLTAAKLHDICMGPSEEMMQCLTLADRMYEKVISGGGVAAESVLLEQAAEKAGLSGSKRLKLIGILSRSAAPGQEARKKLGDALAAFHDESKRFVRKNHAPLGALFVLDHAEAVKKSYGKETDIAMVASLVMLHSTSSGDCRVVGYDNESARSDTARCIDATLRRRGWERPQDERWLKTTATLAAILRLADTRRSGRRIRTIDDVKLEYRVTGDGAELYMERNGYAERISKRQTHDILVAECCTEFGEIRAEKNGGEWEIIHRLEVSDWQNEEIWNLFRQSRLATYIKEIMTAELSVKNGIKHRIIVRLLGGNEQRKKNIIMHKSWCEEGIFIEIDEKEC